MSRASTTLLAVAVFCCSGLAGHLHAAGRGEIVGTAPRAVLADYDTDNARQRFLLLTSRGPLVVESELTVDGRPYRKLWAKLVAMLLADADTNNDGEPTWEEGLANPRFGFGMLGMNRQPNQIKQMTAEMDKNQDGLIDHVEARLLLKTRTGAGAFMVAPNRNYPYAANYLNGSKSARKIVLELLDTDKDNAISAAELKQAAVRLQSRDANDDQMVSLQELTGAPAFPMLGFR